MGYCICIFNMEDMRMCSQIQERVTVVLNSEGEYPAAAAALLVRLLQTLQNFGLSILVVII